MPPAAPRQPAISAAPEARQQGAHSTCRHLTGAGPRTPAACPLSLPATTPTPSGLVLSPVLLFSIAFAMEKPSSAGRALPGWPKELHAGLPSTQPWFLTCPCCPQVVRLVELLDEAKSRIVATVKERR